MEIQNSAKEVVGLSLLPNTNTNINTNTKDAKEIVGLSLLPNTNTNINTNTKKRKRNCGPVTTPTARRLFPELRWEPLSSARSSVPASISSKDYFLFLPKDKIQLGSSRNTVDKQYPTHSNPKFPWKIISISSPLLHLVFPVFAGSLIFVAMPMNGREFRWFRDWNLFSGRWRCWWCSEVTITKFLFLQNFPDPDRCLSVPMDSTGCQNFGHEIFSLATLI